MSLEVSIDNLANAIKLLAAAITSDNLAGTNPYPATIAGAISDGAARSLTESVMGAAKEALDATQKLPVLADPTMQQGAAYAAAEAAYAISGSATYSQHVPQGKPAEELQQKKRGPGRPRKDRTQPEEITRVDTAHVTAQLPSVDTLAVEETEAARADASVDPQAVISETDEKLYTGLSAVITKLCATDAGYNKAMDILDFYRLDSAKKATMGQYEGLMGDCKRAIAQLENAAA